MADTMPQRTLPSGFKSSAQGFGCAQPLLTCMFLMQPDKKSLVPLYAKRTSLRQACCGARSADY